MIPNRIFPLARSSDLATQEMNDETLVYDKRSHAAHCLNPLAALVWKHCDGRRSKEDLAAIVHRQLGLPADLDVIELAVQELAQINLLEQTTTTPCEKSLCTRREAVRRLGISSAAALILAPLVSSIMTQSAMAQASPATTAAPTAAAAKASAKASDRNLKEHFADVDVHQVLQCLASIPIQTWNYRTDDAAIRHIGPMAQDFAAAFRVGTDDKSIHMVDASGVAFAAIQALYQMLQSRDEQMGTLRAELDELQQRLDPALQGCA